MGKLGGGVCGNVDHVEFFRKWQFHEGTQLWKRASSRLLAWVPISSRLILALQQESLQKFLEKCTKCSLISIPVTNGKYISKVVN